MKAKVHIELEDLVRMQFDQHRFSLLPNQPIHSLLSGRNASRLRGRGLLFEELRRYRPGDDIRSIDWRATARMKKTHVRVFSEEKERTVLFITDQRIGMQFGSKRATKAVAACELAALGAWRGLKVGDRVSAIIFGDDKTAYVRPHRSRAAVHRICRELVRMNHQLDIHTASDNPSALNRALEQAARLVKHDALVVLITDGHGADEETHRLTERLAAHNDMIAVLVYDPLGIRLPAAEGLTVTDGTAAARIPADAAFAEKFEDEFVQWGRLIRDRFSSLKVPVLPICTHEEVGDQVLAALGYGK